MAASLTPTQARLLDFIQRFQATNRFCPSYDEMRAEMGVASRSGISKLVLSLEDRGHIRRRPNCARSIEIIEHNLLADVPTVSLIAELSRRGVSVPRPCARTHGTGDGAAAGISHNDVPPRQMNSIPVHASPYGQEGQRDHG